MELLPPGDLFGLFAAIDTRPSDANLVSQKESTLLWLPKEKIRLLTERYPSLVNSLIEDIFQRLRRSHDLSRALAHDQVEVRVASAINALLPHFSRALGGPASSQLVVEITRQEIAEMIGSTPETVIRITKAMEREGILDLAVPGTVKVLNADEIQARASVI